MPRYSTKLPTKQRKHPYFENRETDSGLGGWSADATISDRPKGELSEVFNMRKMRSGELEVRTGYRQYAFPDAPTDPGRSDGTNPNAQIPLWKAEYRMDDVFVDVTFFSKGSNLYALIFNPATEENRTDLICSLSDGSKTEANPKVCAYQFQTYLIVSVLCRNLSSNDAQVFALSPDVSDKATLVHHAWLRTTLGKQVTPAPNGFTFSPTTTGKLLAFIPTGFAEQKLTDPKNATDPQTLISAFRVNGYKVDATTGENVVSALDIRAPYFLASDGGFNGLPTSNWRKAKQDPSTDAGLFAHLKSRGWWGRAVIKRKVTDARGQTHIITEAPSTDYYIEDRTYCPPTISLPGSPSAFPPIVDIEERIPPRVQSQFTTNGDSVMNWENGVALPSNADFSVLRQKFLDAFGKKQGHEDPLYFTAIALGAAGDHTTFIVVFDTSTSWDDLFSHKNGIGKAPYKLECGSWEISGAPNAVYTWADFKDANGNALDPTTDTTLYSIDFYRTAYSFPDEKDNAIRDPLWGTPYNYGYVGTLHSGDASFTDNIADTALLFDQSPLDAEGYLEGEFAGEVMRPYQDHLVLGNIRTKYKVRTPWSGMQCFDFIVGNANGFQSSDFAPQTDGYGLTAWWYRYIDRDGHESDATPISLLQTGFGTLPDGQSFNVAFMFPRGYSDRIVSARLIRGIWSAGSRTYYEEGTIALSTGAYSAALGTTGFLATTPKGSNINAAVATIDDDPGYIIWSKVNDPWAWPQENNENEHDQNPITALDEVIGPLYVASDKGIVMTRLNGYREPVHTSGTGVGCISRYACVKVDKVVFMLSASGLIYVEGSGVVPMAADIETEINIRLREIINGQPSLHGVRERVSMCYLANRKELWITFPATDDVGGALPARTFIVKFLGGKTYAYEFQISVPHHDGPLNSGDARGVVIHLPHADGTMWSAFYDAGTPNDPDPAKRRPPSLYLQDNDDARKHWAGDWAFQLEEGLGVPNVTKTINQVNFLAASMSKFYLITGMLRSDGQFNRVIGTLVGTPREIRNESIGSPSQAQIEAYELSASEYHLPVSGLVKETTGTPPGIRFYGTPDQYGQNKFKVQSMDVYYDPKSQHKGD